MTKRKRRSGRFRTVGVVFGLLLVFGVMSLLLSGTRVGGLSGPALAQSTPISLPTLTPTTLFTSTENLVPITVASWNIELNDADPRTVAQRIADFEDVDLWGISEVNRTRTAPIFEAAAEIGEDADYDSILGTSGGGDRLLAIYDADRFELLASEELDDINTTGNARAPLVLHLRERETGLEFLFMVNHLYRSRDNERYEQARLLDEWAAEQTLPVIAVGDYNFDWATVGGELDHDRGYDLLTANGEWEWIEPDELVTTQCSGWPCKYQSVLDFVFVAGLAQDWRAESEIVVKDGDFPDDNTTPDHRPVVARFWPDDVTRTGTVNRSSNLRGGAGTNYAVVGSASPGQAVTIVDEALDDTGRKWLHLDDGSWIAAFLVTEEAARTGITQTTRGLPSIESDGAAPTPISTSTPTSIPTSTATPAPPPPAAPSVVIKYIYYDGQVPRVESDEYATIANIANTGTVPVNLSGWRLNADDKGQDFVFPAIELTPGEQIRVYTNEVHPESGGFSFGIGHAIWRNKGECGHLFDDRGVEVSTYCF